jgi:antitoxin ParD1/3/4
MSDILVSLPPALQSVVNLRLAERGYVDAAEYLRDLIRRDDVLDGGEIEWLRAAVAEADASELIDREPEDVIEDIILAYPARDA